MGKALRRTPAVRNTNAAAYPRAATKARRPPINTARRQPRALMFMLVSRTCRMPQPGFIALETVPVAGADASTIHEIPVHFPRPLISYG
jgi:hypothetical protein